MIKTKNNLVIISPVYEDLDSVTRLLQEIKLSFGPNFFFIAVDDGSLDKPLTMNIFDISQTSGVILRLKRNVGHQKAIAIALHFTKNTLTNIGSILIMDSDGEEQPSMINDLKSSLDNTSNLDIVVAGRKSRIESFFFKLFYIIYKLFFYILTGKHITFGNFMIIKKRSLSRLILMQELQMHIAACIIASKLKIKIQNIPKGKRYFGESKMNFHALVLHGLKAVMVFGEDVLVRVGIFSALTALLAIALILLASVLKFLGFATPGWFSIVIGLLILIIIQIGSLSLTTLMINGIVKSNNQFSKFEWQNFIDEYIYSKGINNDKNI